MSCRYPWLTIGEVKTLASGGYYDSEGVLHNAEGCIRCTSVVKATSKRCRNFAIPGELYCHCHGGVKARAAAGKSRLYSAFIQDPRIESVYTNCIENIEKQGIVEELGLLRSLLGKCISKSNDLDIKSLKDVASVIGEIRQLVNDCTKAEIQLGQLIDIGKVTLIINNLAKIVSKYIPDQEVLDKIAKEFSAIPWPATLASTPQPVEEEPVPRVPVKANTVR